MKPATLLQSLIIASVIFALAGLPFVEKGDALGGSFAVSVASSDSGVMQLYYDYGSGYSEPASVRLELNADGAFHEYRFALPQGTVQSLRFDPLDRPGKVLVRAARLLDAGDRQLLAFPLENIEPLVQIASLKTESGTLELEMEPGANDPSVDLGLKSPVRLGSSSLELLLKPVLLFLLLFLGANLCLTQRGRKVLEYAETFDRRFPLVLASCITLLLWIYLFGLPMALETGIDASWQAALIDAHMHNRALGREVVFTYGPLGFLFSFYWPGDDLTTKLAWEYLGKLVLLGAFVGAAGALPLWRRISAFAALVFYAGLFPDAPYMAILVFVPFAWIFREGTPLWKQILALLLLAFLAQVKFTYCLVAAAAVGCTVASQLFNKNWSRALWLLLTFCIGWLLWWLLAGQNPQHIWTYLRRSWEVSSGYPWAMTWEEPSLVFWFGFSLLVSLSLKIGLSAWSRPINPRSLCSGLFVLFTFFLTWKHGFTRADGHMLAFFSFAIFLSSALPVWFIQPIKAGWGDLNTPLAVVGLWIAGLLVPDPFNFVGWRLSHKSSAMLHPAQFVQSSEEAIRANQVKDALPRVVATVGKRSIDMLNFEQGYLFLNRLNYSPRPVLQGYTTYSPTLLRINQRFILSSKRPDYLLVRHSTIDGRYAAQDDSLLLAELPGCYKPILNENGLSLLQRREGLDSKSALSREWISDTTLQFGQSLEIPVGGQSALWIQIHAAPSKLGALRALFYKPADISLVLIDDAGNETQHRLITKAAAEGFIVYPRLHSQEEFDAFMQGKALHSVRSLRIEVPVKAREFWRAPTVSLWRVPALPASPIKAK